MTPIDIRPADLATIRRILREHVPALEVRAFGSRVAWNARETSDLDLALMTDKPLTVARMADLRAAFTHADLPFRVDIVDWESTSEAFRRVVEAEYAVVARGRNRAFISTPKDANGPRRSVPVNPNEPDHETRRFGDLFSESPRNGLTRPKAMRGFGTKMVNMGELFAHARLDNVPMDRVPISESEAGRFLLKRGDLLFARQSLVLEGAGKCSLFVGDDEPVTFESHVTRVRLDQKIASPSYYFYYLRSHHGRSVVRAIVEQGAGASGIRGSDLVTLDVLWTPLPEQRAIAHVLGTLDDKIELNRRMNATLEQMARALFRSWFVDFDPVRAKMEGRDTGLPKEIADLFPDRLVGSELGEIPDGWRASTLADVARPESRVVEQSQRAGSDPLCRLGENEVGRHRRDSDVLVGRRAEPSSSGVAPRRHDRRHGSTGKRIIRAHRPRRPDWQHWLRRVAARGPHRERNRLVCSDFRGHHRPPRSPCGRRGVSGRESEGGLGRRRSTTGRTCSAGVFLGGGTAAEPSEGESAGSSNPRYPSGRAAPEARLRRNAGDRAGVGERAR